MARDLRASSVDHMSVQVVCYISVVGIRAATFFFHLTSANCTEGYMPDDFPFLELRDALPIYALPATVVTVHLLTFSFGVHTLGH